MKNGQSDDEARLGGFLAAALPVLPSDPAARMSAFQHGAQVEDVGMLTDGSILTITHHKDRVDEEEKEHLEVAAKASSTAKVASTTFEQATLQSLTEESKHTDLNEEEKASTTFDEAVTVRPNAEKKKPDIIHFQMFPKTIYDISMSENGVTLDLVIQLRWEDPRVKEVIPDGRQSVILPDSVAQSTIWLPSVEVTNRDIRRLELISTSIECTNAGIVNKVERVVVTVKNKFLMQDFPFDNQRLTVAIASTTYMIGDVVMHPMPKPMTLDKSWFNGVGYELQNGSNYEIQDIDGALKKSRGVMELYVRREFDKYGQSVLVPSCLLIFISCSVFWLPFPKNDYINPRMSLSILCLITFTNLAMKNDRALPPGAPYNWNDFLVTNISCIMFMTVIYNILAQILEHTLACEETGKRMNKQLTVLMPILSIITLGNVLLPHFIASGGILSLNAVTCVNCIILSIFFLAFLGVTLFKGRAEYMSDEVKSKREASARRGSHTIS